MKIRTFIAPAAMVAALGAIALAEQPERRGVAALPGAEAPAISGTTVNQMFNVSKSEVTKLDVRGRVGQPFEFLAPIADEVVNIRLQPHSVLSPNFQLKIQKADGSYEVLPTPQEVTYRGTVDEIPGAIVSMSLMDTGVEGQVLLPNGERYWIEPLGTRVEGAQADDYVVYRSEDSLGGFGLCGMTKAMEDAQLAQYQAEAGGEERGIGSSNCGEFVPCVAQLGVDCDVPFFQRYGNPTAVQNRVTSVINSTNVQYESQVKITHQIVTIIVRSAEPDPYQGPSIDSLLSQLQSHWQSQQTGVQRDIAQLFTGEPTGSTIGLAFLSGVCTSNGYSVVQSDCCGSLNCAADLSAHELGHNWSATHCACPSSTMNPSITCVRTFLNNPDASNNAITQITSFRNSRSCLTPSEAGTTFLPIVDNFDAGTTIDTTRWTGVDTGVTINTFAQNEPSAPNALDIKGTRSIRTATVNASQITDITVNYMTEAGGGADAPEAGESLFVEYFNSSGAWVVAQSIGAPGGAQTTFTSRSVVLPAAASHAGLRIRFRNGANSTTGDDWFIDNVNITGTAALPGAFNLTLPANNATGVSQSPFFDWQNSFAASDYRITVANNPSLTNPRFNELTGGTSSYSTAGNPLTRATQYWWKVVAINQNGQTVGNLPLMTFTTTGSIPGAFTLTSPANGATFNTPGNITFTWNLSTDATAYRVQLDNNADFGSPELDAPGIGVNMYTIPASAMANGTYNWRVIASNALGTTNSDTRTVTIDLEAVPPLPGDLNCDGVVNGNDCSAFALALTNPSSYASTFPGCNILNGDINNDTLVNAADRAGFCALVPSCTFCQAPTPGDMNCDNLVDGNDCAAFQLAMTNPSGYASTYPLCDILAGDFNGDTQVTSADQAGFCALVGSCPFCNVPPCTGDANGDNQVGLSDIAVIIQHWGQTVTPGTNGDLSNGGSVGLDDIAIVIQNWAHTCP
ncbi:MAG TPA: zinc-dependent metalloprotease family protein [Phycisphaerales bacterium]|nr:zinc-dependent metalloprotease family protein [Phycisphaerales bacterium]